jgi:transketolase
MRTAYIETLYELASSDKNVLALISDNGAIVYDKFRRDFPAQYFNFGISEANMTAAAAGLASCGKIPFVYTIGAFLAYRACEFIRNDVCLQNQNVKIIGTGAGFAYSALGPTHHATEDIAILSAMPNLTLFSPASPLDVKKTTRAAYEIDGPVYIRLGTNKEREIYDSDYNFKTGEARIMRRGADVALISTGSIVADVLDAAGQLENDGISAAVLNVHTLKPFDYKGVAEMIRNVKNVIVVEEHNIIGGLGSLVSAVMTKKGLSKPVRFLGLNDVFAVDYGNSAQVRGANGVGSDNIIEAAREMVRNTQ